MASLLCSCQQQEPAPARHRQKAALDCSAVKKAMIAETKARIQQLKKHVEDKPVKPPTGTSQTDGLNAIEAMNEEQKLRKLEGPKPQHKETREERCRRILLSDDPVEATLLSLGH